MAKQFDRIEDNHRVFIETQTMFFTGTAAAEGRVNISPKGMDSLRVLGPNRIIWLNYTGSGNETAGHLIKANRITLMWCGFGKQPLILRCYGTARAVHPRDADWAALVGHFGAPLGARQVYDVAVELVQTSCGFAVPYMEPAGERDTLKAWSVDRGDAIPDYWATRNTQTIDGFDTNILGDDT
ncbi:pyridoxamine 5'-phosphate oxidase family protein [Aliiroseovarius subalbicans]|uniref:pyridoxamine 5'-phosphate oxidase family protein n=1 Tax=Aliiroseovarius subalbicans TaxID=2925840 RepID=UPI001F56B934|nr:pyridoxamine 5'-phosphate oxidase family protein [Aliiroseovarius subalbicans]MCI2398003.1 pyridoxamine 5'-phosphate oxidase family protein [Aliiroseovarius subalbicans]